MKIAYIHVHAYVNVYNLKETYFAHIKKWACLDSRRRNIPVLKTQNLKGY